MAIDPEPPLQDPDSDPDVVEVVAQSSIRHPDVFLRTN